MHKRGISTVVATVLIVLITVAAVTILWGSISPIIKQTAFIEDPNVNLQVDKSEYTVYDPTNNLLSVRVTRGSDTQEISGLKFTLLDTNGNTVSHTTSKVPNPNSGDVYYFVTNNQVPVKSISIIPVYIIEGVKKESSKKSTLEQVSQKDLSYLDEEFLIFNNDENTDINTNLISYYPFITDAKDYAKEKNNGVLSGDVEITNKQADFNKMSGYDGNILIKNSNIITNETEFTIAAWTFFNPECYTLLGLCTVYSEANSDTWEYFAIYYDGFNIGIDSSWSYITAPLTENEWHHIAFVYTNGINGSLYIDGNLVAYDESYYVYQFLANKANIGSLEIYGMINSGSIDDLMIFDKALTSPEIQQIYQIGRSE